MMTMRTHFYRTLTAAVLPFALGTILVCAPAQRCDAQAQTQPGAPTTVRRARMNPQPVVRVVTEARRASPAPSVPAAAPDPEISPAVAKQLAAMQAEIEELKALLKSNAEFAPASARAMAPAAIVAQPTPAIAIANPAAPVAQAADTTTKPEKPEATVPFAYADWTWLNGNATQQRRGLGFKILHSRDPHGHPLTSRISTIRRTTPWAVLPKFSGRTKFQVEQISFGGNFHWQNVNARILTMNGMFGVTTPRNDASAGRGQWDLRGAYKYVSEANAGYHFDVNHGLNIDAGIFVSYIGLFSYYNFDNWTYQPSYVSSNTPWFFNGLRIQWFPTDKLKIEPWIINGWQSYGRLGSKPGLGGQILYRPKPLAVFCLQQLRHG